MRLFKKSLILNIGAVVLLAEILVLSSLGLFYTERFSNEIDRYQEDTIRLPGELMNRQLLKYESVADRDVMTELVGSELLDAMVVGAEGRIYYAYHKHLVGESAFNHPDEARDLLTNIDTESLLILRPGNDTIVSITPLVAFAGAKPFFYVYVKASTKEAQTRKRRIGIFFVLGLTLCVCLTSVLIIAYTRRHVTQPLRELQETADAMTRGVHDIHIHVGRKDEIGDLAQSFAAMNEAIKKNIHELEGANAVIGKREERLAAFIEAMPDLVFILDSHGRYEEIYAPEDNLLYADAQRLKGQLLHDVMPKEYADRFLTVVHKSIETGTVQTLEYELLVQSGKAWFEARVSSFGETAETLGTVWIVRDITYRKEIENKLTTAKEEAESVSQRLRELDQTKSTLVSSVSHELRTPLTSLLGFSKLILKNFATHFWPLAKGNHKLLTKGAQIVENLNVLIHEGNRLTRLINDVLDLNKIEMGYTEWREEQINPADLARQAARAVSGQFDNNIHLTLVTQIDDNLPDIVVDIDRMLQVLLNLLTNAAKFTPEGMVTLSVGRTELGFLRFSVADTGPGIPANEQQQIFEIFHQVSDVGPSDDKPRGAGLGLAICRDIVEHYNGTIWVESEVGTGATFIIEMPLR